MAEIEKSLDKEALERLIKEREEEFLKNGKEVVRYAADPGKTKLKPGQYGARKRNQKDPYQIWLEEIAEGKAE